MRKKSRRREMRRKKALIMTMLGTSIVDFLTLSECC